MYVRSVQFSGQLNKMLLSVDRFCVVLRKEPRELTVKGKRNEKKILHQRLSADMASSFYFSLPVSTIIFSSQDNFLKEGEEKKSWLRFQKNQLCGIRFMLQPDAIILSLTTETILISTCLLFIIFILFFRVWSKGTKIRKKEKN